MGEDTPRFLNIAVPDKEFPREPILERIGGRGFALEYNLEELKTSLHIVGGDAGIVIDAIESSLPGLAFSAAPEHDNHVKLKVELLSCYRKMLEHDSWQLQDIFDFGARSGSICLVFIPETHEEANHEKSYIEAVLSRTAVRESSATFSSRERGSLSSQRELFGNSDETTMLKELIESVDESILSNGMLYKMFVAAVDAPQSVIEYIGSKFLALDSDKRAFTNMEELIAFAARRRSLPFGSGYVKRFLNFYGSHAIRYVLHTAHSETHGDLGFGTVMTNAVHDSGVKALVESPTLNLGTIISGLPGSGKTRVAMHIIDQLHGNAHTRIIVISPTDEWDDFALAHGMHLIRLCDGTVPFNPFRCPEGIDIGRFTSDLAMILAAASDAGPYKRPLEKCLVNAFGRAYAISNRTPEPAQVYEEIQEAIIRLHGRKTSTGVKYTKHGENIKSSLEHLAAILRMPEYSVMDGIRIEELLGRGVVFDLSRASVKTMAYFYALILNQAYAIASLLDSNGDDKLRMLICVEEAQLVFGDEASAAVEDIKYRLQDFRKRGIGLMLLTHNATDIDGGIRRLCQTKLYLKQAADVAPAAARDLVFSYVADDEAVAKLKHLDSRTGAFSFVVRRGEDKLAADTIFIRTGFYGEKRPAAGNSINDYMASIGIAVPQSVAADILIEKRPECETLRHQPSTLVVRFIDETVGTFELGAANRLNQFRLQLIEGRPYVFEALDEKGRTIAARMVKAKPIISLKLGREIDELTPDSLD